ncbi:Aste57867_14610 [Aphanomyces stellatus]|uniref:Aste57867_14610 protein n=1 Tax=Aphanomyces stellatus TaxID=120398 RepID=A0A485L1N7_9STRA|nr:hypothetical protein As57867_014556 [Aphanomyces stellatus]VFT91429.1 Aste57867_14610 [Aphanomyces stellatus]
MVATVEARTAKLEDERHTINTASKASKQIALAFCFVSFFVVVVVAFLVNEYDKGKEMKGYDFVYAYSDTANPTNVDFELFLSKMDPTSYDISITTTMLALPRGVQINNTSSFIPFRLQVGQAAVAINVNTTNPFAPLQSKIPLAMGSVAWYPFDKYDLRVNFILATGQGPFVGEGEPLDATFNILAPQSFDWKYKVTTVSMAPGQYTLTIQVRRRFNLYTVLVFAAIWAVTFSIGHIGSCAVIWKRRPADNPIIFFSALFAVPTVRNTLPGKPCYGCLFDVLCTYFAIAVIFTFLVLVSITYVAKPKPAKTDVAAIDVNDSKLHDI